ncbi:MAG: DNA-processing protein DprA [Lachnospiraceae bacterium]|nr:DNA-processing protein DprA [Lachnospiraceae bacterium]
MKYKIWYGTSFILSNEKKKKLFDVYGNYYDLYHVKMEELKKLGILKTEEMERWLAERDAFPLEEREEYLRRSNIGLSTCVDDDFPKNLLNIKDCPFQLFYKGRLPKKEERLIAVVGARRCTGYGKNETIEFGRVLAKAGYSIVSGMADGVDSLAHKSALAEGQKSYGVLGCGVDICYPKKNMTVYEELQKEGGILSEFPPGTVPQPQFFPIRNRIISGMSDVVLVMEAREKSGSLITARWALEQGRDVFALPGRICDKTSDGCHRIIAEGAGILCSPEGLLADLKDLKNWDYMPILSNPTPKFHLEKEEALVYSCLDFNSKSIDELQKESGLSMTELLPAIYHLCDRKLIEESFIHQYVKL